MGNLQLVKNNHSKQKLCLSELKITIKKTTRINYKQIQTFDFLNNAIQHPNYKFKYINGKNENFFKQERV